jgi:3-hydroxyacyl-CoA dehydrogenase
MGKPIVSVEDGGRRCRQHGQQPAGQHDHGGRPERTPEGDGGHRRTARGARAVVLVCEGSTFFSGADIGEFSGPPKEEGYRNLVARLEQLPVPVVAGMHGTALGGGLEIALACHYRVAEPRARFGLPEVTLGLYPGAGGTRRMPRLIGVEKTCELLLSAAD